MKEVEGEVSASLLTFECRDMSIKSIILYLQAYTYLALVIQSAFSEKSG